MDMTDNNDDVLVKKFFSENCIDVPDDGFSRRVMRRLPDRTRRISRLWTAVCVVIGLLIFFRNKGFSVLVSCFDGIFSDVLARHEQLNNPHLLLPVAMVLILLWGVGFAVRER